MRRAEVALQRERTFEAHQWASEALEMKPGSREAQELMAKVIDQEIANERALNPTQPPEELSPSIKNLQIKTWLERSRSLIQLQEWDQARQAAEQVFRLDPENRESSRLIDEIKDRVRKQGKKEGLFVQDLYQEESDSRIQRYLWQAEGGLAKDRWGAARLAVEKALILDPKNARGRKLLALVEKKEKAAEGR
jgi:tetratricopeptide (TPR) repeat protein